MRWQGGRRSENVEDRRGIGGAGLKIGGLGALLFAVVAMLLGVDPRTVLQLLEQQPQVSTGGDAAPPGGAAAPTDAQADFVSVVLADTEDTWEALLTAHGARYQKPTLVLFSDAVESACGYNTAATGPFYCPPDQKVYIDLSFFHELDRRFGAPGDFAQAYVVAHEVGHHVQNLLGVLGGGGRGAAANAISVMQELQADCFAGVWAHHADAQRGVLEQGDVEEGLNAAAAIGDDRLQRSAGQRVSPESWTHGSSEQRVRWFRQGLQAGRMEACDPTAAAAR
jgi:predicted metalloprotease